MSSEHGSTSAPQPFADGNFDAVVQDRDFVTPLLLGDVVAGAGVRLRVMRGDPRKAQGDPGVAAAEVSLARQIRRVHDGDDSWFAVPVFIKRGFSHRTWFVRRGSDMRSFTDLIGKRVGTNEWPATGNTWARAAARDAGVDLTAIDWVVGPIEGAHFEGVDALPGHARYAEDGRNLMDLLVGGDLDALVCPDPPTGFYEPDSPIERLLVDWVGAEQEFFARTRVYPAYHIIGVRKEAVAACPGLPGAMLDAFEAAKQMWSAMRLFEADTSPWLLADLEQSMTLMGRDWQPYGYPENAAMVAYLCDEMLAQGLLERPVRADEVFGPFENLSGADERLLTRPIEGDD